MNSQVSVTSVLNGNVHMDEAGCWLWTGQLSSQGYGLATIDRKPVLAHRMIYVLLEGRDIENQVLHHVCRVRKCVNPAHLEVHSSAASHMANHPRRPDGYPVLDWMTDILQGVCVTYGVMMSDLIGPVRREWLVKARREAAVKLRKEGLSLVHIGRLMNRDHSTIVHYLQQATKEGLF